MQKRVLAINDISCIGRCSLTAALPIISSFGINTTVLPTSILSTQTGGIDDYTYRDLSGDIPGILSHWKKLGISFDAIYTGFLGSSEQVDMMLALFSEFPDAQICPPCFSPISSAMARPRPPDPSDFRDVSPR